VGFSEALRSVARRAPDARAVFIMGSAGMPVDRVLVAPDPTLDAIAAELTTLVRSTLGAPADTGLGALRELTVVTQGITAVVMAITPDYYLFVALAPGGVVGRARAAMRLACLSLESDFA
jgi:predicted regulator of Ras-like GTPase activity (Roadblock/LC7/MglB family)